MDVNDVNAHEKLPLAGVRVAVTRPAHLSRTLIAALEARGATTMATPTIQILPPKDPRPLMQAARRLSEYDWVIFSSVNAVEAIFDGDPDCPKGKSRPQWAAVGPSTRRRLVEFLGEDPGVLIGSSSNAKSLFEALKSAGTLLGSRVLVPRADIATGGITDWLAHAGARVDSPEAYRTASHPQGVRELADAIGRREVDVVVFSSGSTARALAEARPVVGTRRFRCVSIGPQTSAHLRAAGIEPDVEAHEHHVDGLVEAVIECARL